MSTRRPPDHDGDSIEALREGHAPPVIAERLNEPKRHSYLKDSIYGAIDGAVTTFAVVSGVAGADLSSTIVIILGLANLLGDGFSMAAGNYLGTRAEVEERHRLRKMEERHIKMFPAGEKEEIRQIFRNKGFEGDLLEKIVETISSDDNRWVETMLQEEHGLSQAVPSPLKAAAVTFAAFSVVGLLPLIPFLLQLLVDIPITSPFTWSTMVTSVAFFAVGAAKSRFLGSNWIRSGLETLVVGGAAAALAYACGVLLQGIV